MAQRFSGLQGLGAPINYYDMIPDFRGEALQETQNQLGQQQVVAAQRQNQQAQQEQQRKTQFYDAILNATPEQLPALRRQFPEYAQNIQQEIGIQGAEHAAFVNSALNSLSTASASGNPQQVMQAIQQNAPALASINVSPQDAMQLYQSDPDRFNNLLTAARLGTLPVDKQFDIQNDQAKLAEQMRANRASEALTARGQNISAQNARLQAYAPTSAMQNYSQYAQMLKSDPDGAAVFAQAAGINTAGKKLMKVEKNDDGSITKYYTDGTEEYGKLNQPISGDGMRMPLSINQADAILGKANEGSKQAAGYAIRIREGQDAIKQLIDSGAVSPARAALISKNLGDGMIANTALSPAEQTYLINARDITNAILRKDTGAAITESENRDYAKMYLPQPGDSQAALRSKEQKIEGRFKTFRGESGRVYEAMNVSSKAYDQQQGNKAPVGQPQQASPSIADGATATNPSTGQKIIFRGGRWQPM